MSVKIKEIKRGFFGLVTTSFIPQGKKIFKLEGKVLEVPTQTSIEIGPRQHIEDFHGSFINHSFQPTTEISDGWVVAVKDIYLGEELTFDYNLNETCVQFPFIDTKTQRIVEGSRPRKKPGSDLFRRNSILDPTKTPKQSS